MNAKPPDYNAIYFDSNELIANGWPDPSVKLGNFLYLAAVWGIQTFIPAPVLDETENHWLRIVEVQFQKLATAEKELSRQARLIEPAARVEHLSLPEMREHYTTFRGNTINRFGIETAPYPQRSVEYFFQRATRYIPPFAKDGEGRGFQDAVILQSTLDHLQTHTDLKGILITKDEGIKQADPHTFVAEFDHSRLKVSTLEDAFNELVKFHVDQTVIVPWEEERRNALTGVKDAESRLKEFLVSHLTESALRAGDFGTPASAVKLISVDSVEINYVDTPVPKSETDPNRTVSILIAATAQCTAVLRKERYFLASLFGAHSEVYNEPPPPPELMTGKATWHGGIRATADIRERKFFNIVFESVVTEEELRNAK